MSLEGEELQNFVRYLDLYAWRDTASSEDANIAHAQLLPWMCSKGLPRHGWHLYITKDDSPPGPVALVKYRDLESFREKIFQLTGVRLPDFAGRVEVYATKNLRHCYITSRSAYRRAIEGQSSDPLIASDCEMLAQAKQDFYSIPRLYVALDFEQYEHNHTQTTEFGISVLDTREPSDQWKIATRHLHILDYQWLRNGTYVPDNSQNFRHGVTELVPLANASKIVADLLASVDPEKLCLVFHDARSDVKTLKELGIAYPANVAIIDTRSLFAARQKSKTLTSLSKMLDQLDIVASCLHNAGNDAHGTMQAFWKICIE